MKPVCLAVIVALGATVAAQQPTFRAATTLIEFSIVATDAKGEPVTDLTLNDIVVTEDGKPRPIAFFRFEGETAQAAATAVPREQLEPGLFTNRSEYTPGPPRNITAIVIDSLNTRPQDQTAVRAQVMRYLRALAPNTRVAVYRTGAGIRVLHDFTDDLESLRARIAKLGIETLIQPQSPSDVVRREVMEAEHLPKVLEEEDEALQAGNEARSDAARAEEYYNEQLHAERVLITLKSLEGLGNHLAGIPGRKNLVWISGSLPILTYGARDRWQRNYDADFRETARRLASQGLAIYPVQATGLQGADLGISSVAEGSGFGQKSADVVRPLTSVTAQRLWSTLDLLAEVTGGRSFKNTNDLTAPVKATADDLRGTYSVGFYVSENPDNRWHTFKVRAERSGVRVLHRQGYLSNVPAKLPQNWMPDQWESAIQNPLGSTAIRLDVRANLVAGVLSVVLQIAIEDLAFRDANNQRAAELDIALGERTAAEWTRLLRDTATVSLKEHQQDLRSTLIRFPKEWAINPETTAVRLAVRDRLSGRYGTLDMPLAGLRSTRQVPVK